MLPGGGVKEGETNEEALIREIKEETGFTVIPKSIKGFGKVSLTKKDIFNEDEIFEKINHYYFCEVEAQKGEASPEGYEIAEEHKAVWVDPFIAYHHNQ